MGLCSLPVCWPEAKLLTHACTPGHSQASLCQFLVGSLLLSPTFWCAQGFVCALQESLSTVLWKFCNQIPLASKVKFPEGSQSLCQIPRLGNLLGPRNSTIYLEVKEIALSYFKAYYKAIVIKTVWFWHKDRSNKKK